MSIEQYPSANGVLTSLIWRKTAVGGETSLSGYDNASQALSYTPGQEQVYLNGILLVRGSDYTATNGTSITGLTALVADDFIQINCYNNFSVASVPTASLTGTVTNAQLEGSITNDKLTNSSITINGSAVALGGSVSLAGDIESVTASTGLSGGGNTGALTLTNTMATAIDAKGDLVVGTAADTFSKLGVGANGTVLTAASGEATGLSWTTPALGGEYAAGKNKIMNGDFYVNQRNFSSTSTDGFLFDRYKLVTSTGGSASAQTFTAGSAPVSDYNGKGFVRFVTTGQTASDPYTLLKHCIEDVRTLAGQTVTFSFWAKSASGTPKIALEVIQDFGTGGSPSAAVFTYAGQSTISTSWTRYSITFTMPSLSGKTIGTNANTSLTAIQLWVSAGTDFNARTGSIGIQSNTFDMWGLQLEKGSTATAFQTATGTIQGELAACQRYYYRALNSGNPGSFGVGMAYYAGGAIINVPFPVTMRVRPTALETTGTATDYGMYLPGSSAADCDAVPSWFNSTTFSGSIIATVSSGLTAGNATMALGKTSNAYLGWSAEL